MRHSATKVQLKIDRSRGRSPTAFDAQRSFDEYADHEHQRQAHQRAAILEKRKHVHIHRDSFARDFFVHFNESGQVGQDDRPHEPFLHVKRPSLQPTFGDEASLVRDDLVIEQFTVDVLARATLEFHLEQVHLHEHSTCKLC